MAVNTLVGLGARILDPGGLTKTFIDALAAKALDPTRWVEEAKLIRIRHIVLTTWQAVGIATLLHTDDVVRQVAEFLNESIPDETSSNKISAMDLLFGILKDSALDAWKPNERLLVAKCLNYVICYKDSDSFTTDTIITLTDFASKTITQLYDMYHPNPWGLIVCIVFPMIRTKKTALINSFFAHIVNTLIETPPLNLQSPAKTNAESRTVLKELRQKLKTQNSNTDPARRKTLLTNIDNVLQYGVCIDSDDALETTIDRVFKSIQNKLDLYGLFIRAERMVISPENAFAFSASTAAEIAIDRAINVPDPVRWIGYSIYPELFWLSRKAILAVFGVLGATG